MRHGFIKVASATPTLKTADCSFNASAIIRLIQEAHEQGVHLLVLPQMCVTGATCGDLIYQQSLLDCAQTCAAGIVASVPRNMVVVFGSPVRHMGKVYNCAVVASASKVLGLVPREEVSCETDFAEQRVVMDRNLIFTCNQLPSFRLACTLEKDISSPKITAVSHTLNGATVIATLSSVPETSGTGDYRKELYQSLSRSLACAFVYAGAGKGESTTDHVFTGPDMVCENGKTLAHQSLRPDRLLVTELDVQSLEFARSVRKSFHPEDGQFYRTRDFDIEMGETSLTRKYERFPFLKTDCEEVLRLQALGLEGRLEHINCRRVILGISGGLDSTLALLVAVRAFDNLGYDRSGITCVTMPCFGTTDRTRNNAEELVRELGASFMTVDIKAAVSQHFEDIGQDCNKYDAAYENAQARERTQVLMDLANRTGGLVVGTGDLSELALGWATFNGDHMSNYGVNASVPKTLVRALVEYEASRTGSVKLAQVLASIVDTPISPELVPGKQQTEDLVGPYELHDFFLYRMMKDGCSASKILRLARYVFDDYDTDTIAKWLRTFCTRFFSQQFKRNCMPDGPDATGMSLSPRGGWEMPSDASSVVWKRELEEELYGQE